MECFEAFSCQNYSFELEDQVDLGSREVTFYWLNLHRQTLI